MTQRVGARQWGEAAQQDPLAAEETDVHTGFRPAMSRVTVATAGTTSAGAANAYEAW